MKTVQRSLSVGVVAVVAAALLAGCGGDAQPEADDPNSGIQYATGPWTGNDDPPLPAATPDGTATSNGYPATWTPVENPTTEKEKILNAWAEYWKAVIDTTDMPMEQLLATVNAVAIGDARTSLLQAALKFNNDNTPMKGHMQHRPIVVKSTTNKALVKDCADMSAIQTLDREGNVTDTGKKVSGFQGELKKEIDGRWVVESRGKLEGCGE